jgi:lysozyme
MDVKDYIKLNEGLRLKPYRCSANKLTIGYGRNLEDVGISKKEAEFLLADDIGECFNSLLHIFNHILFSKLTYNRQMVLVDLIFNLGNTKFLGFEKMIQAIKDNDFEEASLQILDSNYARQLPNRSGNNAKLMREG